MIDLIIGAISAIIILIGATGLVFELIGCLKNSPKLIQIGEQLTIIFLLSLGVTFSILVLVIFLSSVIGGVSFGA